MVPSAATRYRAYAHYLLSRRNLHRRSYRVVKLYSYFRRVLSTDSSDRRFQELGVALIATGNQRLFRVPEVWWKRYFLIMRSPETEQAEAELLETTESLTADLLPAESWHELYRICLFSGLFLVAYSVRSKAAEAYQREAVRDDVPLEILRRAFALALEAGDGQSSKSILERLALRGEPGERLKQGAWFSDLMCKGVNSPDVTLDHDNRAESNMFSLLNQRTVAVVGPVASSQINGPEIDSYDAVVKFNYRGGEQGCDPESQGARIDISYYNIDQSKYISRNAGADFPGKLEVAVFLKEKGLRVFRGEPDLARSILSPQWLLFDSEFHAGTNAILDLFRFSPNTVKLFNSDLMLTAGRYKGYWRPGTKSVNYCLSFAKTHDPIMQYNYIQKLWASGFLSVDARLFQIMSQGAKGYLKDLQSVHGREGRKRLLGK